VTREASLHKGCGRENGRVPGFVKRVEYSA